ncbi:MAG: hypothetical protein ISR48_06070 [Alphaproteobacteria bacterium]|nr:hypothetical protein [Alphaproteobacteria bacterium]
MARDGGYTYEAGKETTLDWVLVYPFIFMIPALMFIEIRLVGRLFLPEVILAGILPFLLLARGKALMEPLPRIFLIIMFLWLVGQVATDLIRSTPTQDYVRGWAKILNTMINFMSIYLITFGNRRRLNVFALGVTAGYFLMYFLNPSEQMAEDPWKFGLGLATALLFCNIGNLKQVYRTGILPVLCLLAPATLSMLQASRSLAGISFLSAVYVAFQFYIGGRKEKAQKMSPLKMATLMAVGIAAAAVLLEVYSYAASSGMLGRDAQYKYEMQSQGQFGILLGGRAEIFVSIQAISDSPFIGHGSWAKDPRYAALLLKLENFGYEISSLSIESGLIPSHSHLFGAWVESGILGALMWMWVILFIVITLIKLSQVRESLTPLAAFVGIQLIWDILFSPFGAERRFLIPFFIIVLMAASKLVDSHYRRLEHRSEMLTSAQAGVMEGRRGWWRKMLKR